MGLEDDGHEENSEFPGAVVNLSEMVRADGQVAKAAAESFGKNSLGVLKMALKVVLDEREYRQLLWVADFFNLQKAREAVAAIDECKLCGIDYDVILDDIAAMAAVNAKLRNSILDAASHFQYTTNYKAGKNDRSQSGTRSPIS